MVLIRKAVRILWRNHLLNKHNKWLPPTVRRRKMDPMSSNDKKVVLQPANVVARVDGYWSRRYAEDFLAAARAFQTW